MCPVPRAVHRAAHVHVHVQVALAGFMPSLTYAAALLFTLSAVGITLWHFSASAAQAQSTERLSVWNLWQLGSGLVGLAVVPQVSARAPRRGRCPEAALRCATCHMQPAPIMARMHVQLQRCVPSWHTWHMVEG